MARQQTFVDDETIVSAEFLNGIQDVEAQAVWGVVLSASSSSTIQIAPVDDGSSTGSAGIVIDGQQRIITAPVTLSLTSLSAGTYDLWISATNPGDGNVADGFALQALENTDGTSTTPGSTRPTASGYGARYAGQVDWSGSAITGLRGLFQVAGHGARHASDGGDPLSGIDITQLAEAVVQALIPTGCYLAGGLSEAPPGFLLCDGTAYSRSEYASLYTAIGTTWGNGDGSTTFNVPDFRGRVPIGAGSGSAAGASDWALGSQPTSGAGGEEKHTLATTEIPAHDHTFSGTTEAESASHTHAGTTNSGEADIQSAQAFPGLYTVVASNPVGNTNFGASDDGFDAPSSGIADVFSGSGESHDHSDSGHVHTFTSGTESASHDHPYNGTTASAGGGAGHNNVQPVSVANWFIKT